MFELNGIQFKALNGGPHYQFSPAISFVIECQTQAEIDHYWDRLVKEGTPSRCGWLSDKYGVSWQIVPTILGKLMADPERAPRVVQAFMQMTKLDITALENA